MIPPPKMSMQVILALVFTVAITLAIVFGSQYVAKLQRQAERGAQRGQTIQATSGIQKDSVVSQREAQEVEIKVTDARVRYKEKVEEIETHEPATRAYGDQPVPRSLRNAARERRLARERSGRAGEQRDERAEAEEP